MTAHQRFTTLAATALDFELSRPEALELESHLAGCLACRRLAASLRTDAAALRNRPRYQAPASLHPVVLASKTPAVRPAPAMAGWQFAALLLTLGLLLALVIGSALVGSRRGTFERLDPPPPITYGRQAALPRLGSVSAAIPAGSGLPADLPGCHPFGGGGGGPCPTAIGFGEGAVWVSDSQAVGRIDPAANAVVATIRLGDDPGRFGFGAGAVWVSVPAKGAVVRIDPSTNRVVANVAVGGTPVGVAFGDGDIRVADGNGMVSRIDPATNMVRATFQVPGAPRGLAFGAGSVWVASYDGGAVSRLDPTTNTIMTTIELGDLNPPDGSIFSTDIYASESAVWVATYDHALRIDPASNQIVASVFTYNGDIAVDPSGVWIARWLNQVVERIDPTTNAVVSRLSLPVTSSPPSSELSIVTGAGSIWVRSYDTANVLRIDPNGP